MKDRLKIDNLRSEDHSSSAKYIGIRVHRANYIGNKVQRVRFNGIRVYSVILSEQCAAAAKYIYF